MSEERLRRQLRAQAVVNRQLHAELAEVTAQLRAVQGNDASAVRVLWRRLEAVLPEPRGVEGGAPPPGCARHAAAAAAAPRLRRAGVRWASGSTTSSPRRPRRRSRWPGSTRTPMYLLEGTQKRAIPRMLVGALLEADLGPARPITESELDEFDEGPPVEVLAAPTGFPFVVMGGRRRPIRGYPVPFVMRTTTPTGSSRVSRSGSPASAGGPHRAATAAGGVAAQPGPRPMARVIRRARSSAWWGRIEILAVIAAALVPACGRSATSRPSTRSSGPGGCRSSPTR